jgi:cytochrome c556
MINPGGRLVAFAGLLFLAALTWSQCSKAAPPARQSAAPILMGGGMTPVVSVKELMANMIDPVADNIFDAVWWDVTSKGIVEYRPRTDEDWEKVKTGAVTLAEGIYLLKVPRLFTPPGDVNNSLGPHPPELSPTQIKEKLDKDPVLWTAKIEALRNVAREVIEVVKKKDVDGLFRASGDLDEACEACHLEYWYPGDKAAVLADRNARARFEKPPKPGTLATPAKKK